MRLPLILALLALSAPSYADRTAPLPPGDDPAQEARPEPAAQLMHLERTLARKQQARDNGELPPEKYQEFIAAFRRELEAVMGRIPPTAENKGLHAQILARLGPEERGQALASLEQALAESPESPALLIAKGSILYEQRDFQSADALALQAWEAGGRKDPRAWALHKLSEGRVSGVRSGEAVPRLKPASDFARPDWSIPERHDINEQGLGRIAQAAKAFRAGDIAAARMHTQEAMNADPTSKSMQDLYRHAQANFAKRAEIGTALEQAIAAKTAGRHQDALAWMQKAYDLFPNDHAYEALQAARRRAAEEAARRAAEPAKEPIPERGAARWGLIAAGLTGIMLLSWGAASQETRDHFKRVFWEHPKQEFKVLASVAAAAGVILIGMNVIPPLMAASAPTMTSTSALAPAFAGAGSGGAALTGVSWQQAAVGGLKAGTLTLATMVGIKTAAEHRPLAQQREPGKDARTTGNGGDPSATPRPGPIPLPAPLPISTKPDDSCSIKPTEDILNRFVDGTRLAPRFLDKHEEAGGHTKAMHIDKKITFLVGRLPQKPGASSFPDQDIAEKVIRQTVVMKEPAIRAWASQPPPIEPKPFYYSGTNVIGYGVTREKPALPQNKTNARTVLHMLKDCRILILTAYPE